MKQYYAQEYIVRIPSSKRDKDRWKTIQEILRKELKNKDIQVSLDTETEEWVE